MIERIRELADKAGGLKSFARQLGIKHQSLYSWRDIPPGRVRDVERITGVSRHDLRPDIYGPAPTPQEEVV
ncbi:transcriptional regulator [Xanthobacter agilis]|nr:YdaS family helix-turn-helix protein [Xanthobacter agilis]